MDGLTYPLVLSRLSISAQFVSFIAEQNKATVFGSTLRAFLPPHPPKQ